VGQEANLFQTTCKIVWYGIMQLDLSGNLDPVPDPGEKYTFFSNTFLKNYFHHLKGLGMCLTICSR